MTNPTPPGEALRAQQDDAYDHGPQAETVEEAARDVGKWLNERPNRPLDLRHVAMLTHHAIRTPHVQTPAEIEHVAGDVSKNGAESDMAQQPAPSAAAEVGTNTKTAELLSTTVGLLMGYREGGARQPYKPGSVVAKVIDEVVDHLKDWPYPEPSPTPQADSQPAPVAAFEVADAMADSQYLAGVSAGWNAANADDPNAALQKLHESRAGYLKPLSAARAPAESVLEDAARLDWLDQNIFHREMGEWDAKYGGLGNYNMWVMFAPKGAQGSARNILDAARKQGGAT